MGLDPKRNTPAAPSGACQALQNDGDEAPRLGGSNAKAGDADGAPDPSGALEAASCELAAERIASAQLRHDLDAAADEVCVCVHA